MVGLAIVAAVSGDVSHLLGGSEGYNYPKPSISFDESSNVAVAQPPPSNPEPATYLPPAPAPPAPVGQQEEVPSPSQPEPIPAPYQVCTYIGTMKIIHL